LANKDDEKPTLAGERFAEPNAQAIAEAYFAPLEGKRGGMIFFNLTEPSQIVEVVEPLFLDLHAETQLVPVMNGDDLRKGLTKAAQK